MRNKQLLLGLCLLATPLQAESAKESWMTHLRVLGADDMEGRAFGTPGYARAADYVAREFRRIGLIPAGERSYFQSVKLLRQDIDRSRSAIKLVGPEGELVLAPGDEMLLGRSQGHIKGPFAGDLVFIGYGLSLPEQGFDDFAGQDLTDKIVVVFPGIPKGLTNVLASHSRATQFWKALRKSGAKGVIWIPNPPEDGGSIWRSMHDIARPPGYRIAPRAFHPDGSPVETPEDRRLFSGILAPKYVERLFKGSAYTLDQLTRLAIEGARMPSFAMPMRLEGEVVATETLVESPNVIGWLPGNDPKRKDEYIILTAHLDHMGMEAESDGQPKIYNGVMDNAAGVSTLIDVAHKIRMARPERSILFVALTAEERGLLGSRYFVTYPTIAKEKIVANLNMDMYLPLWPLTHITSLGAEESNLGAISMDVARSMGIKQVKDWQPERNLFVRSDQYNFIREGIPALAFKFAPATKGRRTIETNWMNTHYHQPSDNLNQRIFPKYAERFNKFMASLTLAVAKHLKRPEWNADSPFRQLRPATPAATRATDQTGQGVSALKTGALAHQDAPERRDVK